MPQRKSRYLFPSSSQSSDPLPAYEDDRRLRVGLHESTRVVGAHFLHSTDEVIRLLPM